MSSRSKNWCFTVNNYTEEDVAAIEKLIESSDYVIVGKEQGEQGTPHLQGYVQLKKKTRLGGLKKILPRAHLQVARGSAEDNRKYCSKEGDFKEYGTAKEIDPGKREKRRWDEIWENAKKGDIEAIEPEVRIRHYNAIKRIKKDYSEPPPDLEAPCGLWITGESGVGKSTYARKHYPGAYIKNVTKWWDSYKGQDYVIIDDIDPRHKDFGYLLKIWADKFAFNAEEKGGAMMIRPKKIIVTSQYMPHDVWDDALTVVAINRRFEIKKL